MLNIIRTNKKLFLFYFICTTLIFFFSSKFSPLYNFNYWVDINVYYTLGKSLWYNKVIYKDLFDHKGPLLFFIYSLGYLFSSPKFLGMFFVQVCFQFIAVIYAYKSIRLFVNKKYISILGSLFIFFFFLNFNMEGGAAEEFIFVFQSISLFYFLRYFKGDNLTHNYKDMIIHGFMLGCVFFIKFNLILFWFFPLLSIFVTMILNKQYKNILYNIGGLLFGLLLISVFILFYFCLNNALSDFWEAYIKFNYLYSKQGVFIFKNFLIELYFKVKRDYLIFAVIFAGIIYFVFSGIIKNMLGKISLLLSFILMIFLLIPNSLYLHYYLIPLMIFSIPGIIVIVMLVDKFLNKMNFSLNKPVFLVICIFTLIFLCSRKNLFEYSIRTLYNRDFPQTSVEKFASIISADDDRTLMVIDIMSGVSVFTACEIVPNVKYFYYPNIDYRVYSAVRDTQNLDIQNKTTKYIIMDTEYESYYRDVLDDNYALVNKYPSPNGNMSFLYRRK